MTSSAEQFKNNLKTEFTKNLGKNSESAGQTMMDLSNYISSMTEEEEYCDSCDKVKSKCVCKKKKKEAKEATGSGSSGAYVGPVFGGNDEFWEKSRAEMKENIESVDEDLGRWFKEKWVDVSKKVNGKHPPCGRKEANGKSYPKCRPSKKVSSDTPKVASSYSKDEKEKMTQQKRREEKKEPKIGKGNKPTMTHFDETIKETIEKIETKEATTSGSVGGYETPSMWAKSTKKKDWGPSRKTQYSGGSFVKVKKKCTKFPYCNQGDINSIKLTKNESVKEAIKNVAKKMNVSEDVIKTILEHEYEKVSKRPK